MFDNFLIAPFRLILLLLGLLVIHQFAVRQHLQNYTYSYFVRRTAIYGAALIVGMFVLVQLNMYSTFTLILLLFGISFYKYFRIGSLLNPGEKDKNLKRRMLITFFIFLEKRERNLKKLWHKELKNYLPKQFHKPTMLLLSIGFVAILMRFGYVSLDSYTLSKSWLESLDVVKNFDDNFWLIDDYKVVGELALVNVYAKLTGISKEMALYTFGFIEAFMLCTVIFYLIATFTQSRWKLPFIGTMFFAAVFYLLPLNPSIIMEHSPIYLGLFFALIFFVFLCRPKQIAHFEAKYFLVQFLLVSAVALINYYVLFMLMPILLVASLVDFGKNKKFIVKSILAYLLATSLMVGIKLFVCYARQIDIYTFFTSNILSVDTYSYFPTLLVDFNTLLLLYQITACIGLLGLIFLRLSKKNIGPNLSFTIFFLLAFNISVIGFKWMDIDLFFKALGVLYPIQFAISLYAVLRLLDMILIRKIVWLKFKRVGTILLLAFLTITTLMVDVTAAKSTKTGEVKKEIVHLYDKLYRNQFQNSYIVVNNYYGYKLAQKEHLFLTHQQFIKDYAQRDSIFHAKKNLGAQVALEDDEILPESVFVVVTKDNAPESLFHTKEEASTNIMALLEQLKGRGRSIRTYQETEHLKVLEIINAPNLSSINEMIFNYDQGI
ncbi:hypothetical protein [Flavobacterium sp. ASW18X]|uniref:hypothetical protein n=1 Tax=Flavobacterium sp. ASW18X TaxID=2572595 RepID=UPI0010AE2D4F|nr:hypothetical protein [Flavobacterium sp. ASW18X]TKD67310.1 hypothetical protein FBT53_00460 [Flavobacterium sp. ASW18X]